MSGTALETRRRVPFPWESLAEIFFPPACLACAQVLGATAFFCPSCAETLEPLPEPRCRQCSEPGDFKRGRCSRCTARPPPFERAVAPFSHQGAIARAIHELKYEDHPELAFRLAQLLARAEPSLAGGFELLCPIPLHEKRFRARKFDQAQLLAAALARQTGLRCAPALTRWRQTTRQVGLTESERELNVAGAFRAAEVVRGQRVLLIDDVFTTGATARAAASALRQAGARQVAVLTVARAFSL